MSPSRGKCGKIVWITILAILFSIIQTLFVPWYCFSGNVYDNGTLFSPSVVSSSTGGFQKTMTTTNFESLRQPRRQSSHTNKSPDGYFNTYPVYLQDTSTQTSTTDYPSSYIHCVGETPYEETSWKYRSCHYTYMCYDPTQQDFFLVDNDSNSLTTVEQLNIKAKVNSTTAITPNNTAPYVALGGINPRWNGTEFHQGFDKIKWSPRTLTKIPSNQYYMLEDDVILVPFHSFAGHNVGHLLWDDFLPIYTLLQIFGFLVDDMMDPSSSSRSSYRHLLLRVDTLSTLYASCDIRRNKRIGCNQNFEKFLPLMGINPKSFTTITNIQWTSIGQEDGSDNQLPSYPICTKHALAGLGMLTDHGMTDHGWEPLLSDGVHNVGRGPNLYQFRNYMLHNMGIPVISRAQDRQSQFHILLNAHSSRDVERDFDFEEQQRVLKNAFPNAKVSIVQLSDYTLQEQLELVSQRTNIFVSTCGGGSMTAFFLPRGSSVIFYYAEKSGFNFDKFALTGGPALLDWDLFNNLGYLSVHWLPIGLMNTKEGLESLIHLVGHEMDIAIQGI